MKLLLAQKSSKSLDEFLICSQWRPKHLIKSVFLVSVLGENFLKYIEAFKPFFFAGLRNFEEYQVLLNRRWCSFQQQLFTLHSLTAGIFHNVGRCASSTLTVCLNTHRRCFDQGTKHTAPYVYVKCYTCVHYASVWGCCCMHMVCRICCLIALN